MSMLSKKLLVPALCITLGACAFKKDDDKATPEQAKLADDVVKKIQDGKDEINVQLMASNVTVKFEDGAPEYYQMNISWPENVGSMDIHLDGNFIDTVLGVSSVKLNVAHSRKFTLHLRAFASAANGGRLLSEYKAEYESPKDIVYKNETVLTSNIEQSAHRIYFNKNARIYTNGNNLKITSDQLIIDNEGEEQGRPEETYHIVTFRDPTIATSITGKSSFIEINASKALGTLKLAMTGRDGTDGKNGLDQARIDGKTIPTTQAANGSNGQNGEVSRRLINCHSHNFDIPCDNEQEPICKRQPTNGSDGANGLPGFDGTNGVNGGATGNLFISITDDSQFSLEVYQRPGKGGRGGKGSPGQLGGKGGAPGNNLGICNPAKAGTNGKNGEDGKDGYNGATGQLGEIVTRVKNLKITVSNN